MALELQTKLNHLNARFTNGHPSNTLREAGVLVHQIDALDENHVGENPTPWLPCTPAAEDVEHPPGLELGHLGCAAQQYADHLEGSIINPKVPFLYSDDAVGFIVAPEHAAVRCSFPEDGGTMSRYCHPDEMAPRDCLDGCYSGGEQCITHTMSASHQMCYAADSLAAMMAQCEKFARGRFDNNNGCRQGNGCRYNEIVLDKRAWIDRQPHATEALFYPVGGDADGARSVHRAFLKHYGVNARQVPLVRINLDRIGAPFEAPAASDGYVKQPLCAALYAGDSKLWHMFGTKKTWQRSGRGEKRCWHYQGGSAAFFEKALRGERCAVNWFEGAGGELGQPEARPSFAHSAPALLGFDEDLMDFCSQMLQLSPKGSFNFNSELARRCVAASQNILRLLSSRPGAGWTMCQNFEWLLCAAQGKLPGQEQPSQMRFASAPKALTLAEWNAPKTYPCDDGHSCAGRYTVGDVFFSEVCLLHRICHNGDELFRLERGQPFKCEFSEDGYRDAVRDLLRTTVNIDTRVDDYYKGRAR